MSVVEEAAKLVCREDGQDWDTLASTYNGRQRLHDYRRTARAVLAYAAEIAREVDAIQERDLGAANSGGADAVAHILSKDIQP